MSLKKNILLILLVFISCNNEVKQPQLIDKSGMIFIEGGFFEMGADNDEARPDEYPKHKIEISSFWMDETEVTKIGRAHV